MKTVESTFSQRVRGEMARQGVSIKGLARRIDPTNVDRVRRNLHRWLDEGILPHRSSRREVATALGLDEHALDDDEESDPVSIDELLRRRIDLLVRESLKNNDPAAHLTGSTAGSSTQGA